LNYESGKLYVQLAADLQPIRFMRLRANVVALDFERRLKFRVWTVVRAENVCGTRLFPLALSREVNQ